MRSKAHQDDHAAGAKLASAADLGGWYRQHLRRQHGSGANVNALTLRELEQRHDRRHESDGFTGAA